MTDENTPHSGSRWEPASMATSTPRQPAAADAAQSSGSGTTQPGSPA